MHLMINVSREKTNTGLCGIYWALLAGFPYFEQNPTTRVHIDRKGFFSRVDRCFCGRTHCCDDAQHRTKWRGKHGSMLIFSRSPIVLPTPRAAASVSRRAFLNRESNCTASCYLRAGRIVGSLFGSYRYSGNSLSLIVEI